MAKKKPHAGHIAAVRRKAVAFCKENGIKFDKSCPTNKELLGAVCRLKNIAYEEVTRKASIDIMDSILTSFKTPAKIKKQKRISTQVRGCKIIQLENFYTSDEWRELRYRVLAKYEGKCLCCGRSYREHGVIIHVDHIKPKSKYPELALDINNLQILCEDCNMGKSNKDDTDWREVPPMAKRIGRFIRTK